MVQPSVNRIGQHFGQYELIEFLGRGGFADVFLGRSIKLSQQLVAVKVLHKLMIVDKSQQFKKEANTILSLYHPHIIRFFAYDVYENPTLQTRTSYPYIVMDYAPNGSLRQKHPRGTSLPPATIVSYIKQIADALQYAHGNQVMHLDVKPENILINAQDKLLLGDFGLATLVSEQEKISDIQGTLSYMAPEQIKGRPDKASDQYALSIMVYEWLCGKLPFTGQSVEDLMNKQLNALPPSLRVQNAAISPEVETVVMKALSKEVRDRYTSVIQFAEALEEAVNRPNTGTNLPPQGKAPNSRNLPIPAIAGTRIQSGPLHEPQQMPSLSPILLNPAPVQPIGNLPEPQAGIMPSNSQSKTIAQPSAAPLQPTLLPTNQNAPAAPQQASPFQTGVPPNKQPVAATPPPTASPLPTLLSTNQAAAAAPQQAVMPPVHPGGAIPQQASPFQAGPPPINPAGAVPGTQQQASPFFAGPPPNQVGSIPGTQQQGTPFQAGPPPNQAGPIPGTQQQGIPFQGGSPPIVPVGPLPGLQIGPLAGYVDSMTFVSPSTPSMHPYSPELVSLADDSPSLSFENIITYGFTHFVKPIPRRRGELSLFLIAGIVTNALGSIFIGLSFTRTMPSHGNEIAWGAFIISVVCSIIPLFLFNATGNRYLKFALSFWFAIFWWFAGGALAIVIGAGTVIGFLPDANIMPIFFFLGSLCLHLILTFKRK